MNTELVEDDTSLVHSYGKLARVKDIIFHMLNVMVGSEPTQLHDPVEA